MSDGADRDAPPQPPAAEAPTSLVERDRDESKVRIVDRRWWARPEGAGEAEAPSLKPTYVEELERQVAEKERLLQEYVARYRDAAREFDEARARMRREVGREVERGRRAMLVELLDVVDNLDRAIEAAAGGGAEDAPLLHGVEMVRSQFLATLEGFGVVRLDADGQPFDPTCHDAISTVPVDDPARDAIVVGVVRHGYRVGDEVLRPAQVAVGRLAGPG